jgi:hypothetical protein
VPMIDVKTRFRREAGRCKKRAASCRLLAAKYKRAGDFSAAAAFESQAAALLARAAQYREMGKDAKTQKADLPAITDRRAPARRVV